MYPYIIQSSVTDINWNGKQLWIDDLEQGRYMAPEILSDCFVERFIMLLSNITCVTFNRINPVMEAETEELRVSVVHESVARSGYTISIRKTPAVCRMNKENMIQSGYCSEEIHDFLVRCVKAHCTIVICGLPGAGKTELLKYLTQFIPSRERAITIEDVMEIHYQTLNPDKDCVEMKVAENFGYAQAIKASLRQYPKWIILSEARSKEARQLLESLSTGASSLTTLHGKKVADIPGRILTMAGKEQASEGMEYDIYRYIDVGVLVQGEMDESGKIRRYIEEIGVFQENYEGKNQVAMVAKKGRLNRDKIPSDLKDRLEMEA